MNKKRTETTKTFAFFRMIIIFVGHSHPTYSGYSYGYLICKIVQILFFIAYKNTWIPHSCRAEESTKFQSKIGDLTSV